MAYTNVIFDTFIKGIETILRAEFKTAAVVYIAEEPKNQGRASIRIWPEEDNAFEAVDPPFLAIAQEYRYSADIVVALPKGQTMIKTTDQRLEVLSRALRILNDNQNYSPSSVYKWHDGAGDEGEKTEEGWKFIYSATVVEPIA